MQKEIQIDRSEIPINLPGIFKIIRIIKTSSKHNIVEILLI